ncbi:sterol desaturase family protein [Sphingomonas sp.]|uniref:sterol desaturase family protein n=1 Tax=Sphingomonas sp. TaxID=28214 RepID=UPI0035C86C7F
MDASWLADWTARASEALAALAHAVTGFAGASATRLAATFLAPGSTMSLPALLLSLAAFAVAVAHRRRGRGVSWRVLRRVLLPRRLFGTPSGRTDAWFALTGITITGVAIGWTLVSAEFVRAELQPWLGTPLHPWLPGWLAVAFATLVLFVAYEFAYFIDHWLMHRVPWLWHFHKVHHQAESLSLLTNFRVHPVDTILFANILALFLGCTQAVLVVVLGHAATPLTIGGTNLIALTVATLLTHLQHSHLWITFGPRWGRWLLAPAHHQIHHSDDPRHHNRNMGDVLAVFDHLFGTFWMPSADREVRRFGVDDGTPDPHGLRAALLDPFIASARALAPTRGPRRTRAPGRATTA